MSSLSSYFYQKSFSHKASIFPYFQAAEKSQHAKLYRYWQIISTKLHNCHILITFVQTTQNKSSYPDDFLPYYKSNPTFCSLEKKILKPYLSSHWNFFWISCLNCWHLIQMKPCTIWSSSLTFQNMMLEKSFRLSLSPLSSSIALASHHLKNYPSRVI